jgi:hypothetical protein
LPSGEHEIYVGGGPNMIGAARPLTWITNVMPLRGGQAIGQRAAQIKPAAPIVIGGGYMPTAFRQGMIDGLGGEQPRDETAQVWTLMRRTTMCELLAMREASLALQGVLEGIDSALAEGANVTAAILAGERVANERGAQDVRTLFSLDGGRTLQPFTGLIDRKIDPLQVYVAVRLFNYWAEAFVPLSERMEPADEKARAVLRRALSMIKSGTRTADVADMIAAEVAPYRRHPVTEGSFANLIGVALEEPPYSNPGATFEALEFYTVKVGVTDGADNHAIVSAVIRVRDDGIDTFWSAA